MVRPNILPRTLRGVGGVRLFDIPGVVYPKEMLVTKTGLDRRNGQPYRESQGWGFSSREAAAMLGCTPASARTWLHRRKVPYRIVGREGQAQRLFWRKDKVQALADNRLPIVQSFPSTYISSDEALRILQVGRSTLQRLQERGQLKVIKVRCPSAKGLRKCSYYHRDEVERLAEYLNIMRRKEEEIKRIRCKCYHTQPPLAPISSSLLPRRRKKCD